MSASNRDRDERHNFSAKTLAGVAIDCADLAMRDARRSIGRDRPIAALTSIRAAKADLERAYQAVIKMGQNQ